jgi:hypothetical protein
VEDVQAVLRHRLAATAAVLLYQGDAALQSLARVRHDVLQRRPGSQRLVPGRPGAIVPAPAQEPGHARRLDAHQDGPAVEEDLIQAADQDQGVAAAIQGLQDASGATAGGLHDPVQGRPAGAGHATDDDRQQGGDLAEAQPHRGGRDGELVPFGLGEVDRLLQPVPELGVLGLEGLDPVEELLPWGADTMLGGDGVLDLLGVVVDGLPAAPGVACPPGDISAGPGEDGGGIGDPGHQR